MKASAITTPAFAHYADTIGVLHQSDKELQTLLRRQLVATLSIALALGGVLVGLG